MTDVKKLLLEATPLPWEAGMPSLFPAGCSRLIWNGQELFATPWRTRDTEDAALIVHAVNSLPAYEAVADALAELLLSFGDSDNGSIFVNVDRDGIFNFPDDVRKARAALAQLRGAK
jgi:hypothetical protein